MLETDTDSRFVDVSSLHLSRRQLMFFVLRFLERQDIEHKKFGATEERQCPARVVDSAETVTKTIQQLKTDVLRIKKLDKDHIA